MRGAYVLSLLTALAGCSPAGPRSSAPHAPGDGSEDPRPASGSPARSAYAGSQRCSGCHAEVAERWSGSDHAHAERALDVERDAPAFERGVAGGAGAVPRRAAERLEFAAAQPSGGRRTWVARRAIGVDPLVQYLVEAERGRLQATALAWDPAREEWFDVFGDERRQPGEWGHWTGRGMNWNSQCADCHLTDFVKGYDARGDGYASTWAELGIGCEACHGPLAEHADWYASGRAGPAPAEARPLVLSQDPGLEVDLCGSCHSRRAELVERYLPGQPLLDAFLPELPGTSDTFWPDGRVREEDYEYAPFLLSRLHAGGLTCKSCHDPHSGETLQAGDALCMSCHAEPLNEVLAPIDPAAHSHHPADSAGASCIACHMPVTVYMQRDPRHDHSFPTPDPALSAELGTPDVCTGCHVDRDLAWAAEHAERWWGERLERPRRERARLVAAARAGDPQVVPKLLRWSREEPIPAWRAVAAALLAEVLAPSPAALGDGVATQAAAESVEERLIALLADSSPLVRLAAARALESCGPPADEALIARCREDPVRAVRVAAALALGRDAPVGSRGLADLERWLAHTSDQPTGLWIAAGLDLDRGRPSQAVERLERAIGWDSGSAALFHTLAVAAAGLQDADKARDAMERACRLEPADSDLWRALGLARYEAGDAPGAEAAFLEALRLEPRFARVWKDLALLRAESLADAPGAEEAASRAVALAPDSVDAWWAWIHVVRAVDPAKARRIAEQAAAACPEEASFRAFLEGR